MRRAAAALGLVVALVACGKDGAAPAADDVHASPEAVARAVARAIRGKDRAGFLEAVHPDLRAAYAQDLEARMAQSEEWAAITAKADGIVATIDGGGAFEQRPTSGKDAAFGDQLAALSYQAAGGGHVSRLELVRKDGRWYVGDFD